MSLACITAMRFAPLRIDGSFTLHALTAGKKRGEKRPWKILPLLFPPSQQQTPLSDSRQIRKCAGRMPPPFLPPFFPPSVSCQIGGGERAGGRHAWSVLRYLMMTSFLEASPARSLPPSVATQNANILRLLQCCRAEGALSAIHARVFCPYFHRNAAE